MPVIELETLIHADINTCFDLSRSIDLHTLSTAKTKEKAIAGRTSGLIGMNETVTWQATHFFIRQKLTSKITAYHRPFHFRDEQQQGPFRLFAHDHIFTEVDRGTLMKDILRFQSPAGLLGSVVNRLYTDTIPAKFFNRKK
ncbi:SRPBCC family protein [Niabella hibiscisoli]|uniref:SRPBCC family protein n=1 Tax=Niabella hibiscisoli TaxID=1825928 RepID=UPI001F0EAD81|nr:SRPBCC family protein [Niabella hibiscisoli]MCH5715512.1 SRPBCC family protein [Niabella hibiscisoli]